MKLQVSKRIVQYINEMKKNGLLHIDKAEFIKMKERNFYNGLVYEYNAIKIIYPSSFFATNKYITNAILCRESDRLNISNEYELQKIIKSLVEI